MTNEKDGRGSEKVKSGSGKTVSRAQNPSPAQRRWLQKGLQQPGYKLPLFDDKGASVPARTIQACIEAGWAEPWFSNPIKPDWLVCKLTEAGRRVAGELNREEK